jgi:hypothetical protein
MEDCYGEEYHSVVTRSDSEDAAAPASKGEMGFPHFEHNQWTVEGEIERFGAFGSAASRLHGPKRWLATALVLLFVFLVLYATVGALVALL